MHAHGRKWMLNYVNFFFQDNYSLADRVLCSIFVKQRFEVFRIKNCLVYHYTKIFKTNF